MSAVHFRRDFPFFQHHPETVFLDSAATAQKPQAVIDALTRFYAEDCAPVGRSAYKAARQADRRYRTARQTIARFLDADAAGIIFTKSATESANLLARAFARPKLCKGKNIVITAWEHNSNYLPWVEICRESGAELRVARPVSGPDFPVVLDTLTDEHTVLVSCTAASNVLGDTIPLAEISALCRQKQIPLALDGAQYVAHHPVDVQTLGCDFLFFSGHKVYGPTGSGVLYVRPELLDEMAPFLLGGGMICGDDPECYAPGAGRFEAGSPDTAAFIGLAAAIDYLNTLGRDAICIHEQALARQMQDGFRALSHRVQLLGQPAPDASVYTFVCPGAHPFDLACLLNGHGIAVRSGKMCAQHLFDALGQPLGGVRASLACYNTAEDLHRFFNGLEDALNRLQRK
ncbi:MAG: cysteine desulfurase [Clostridia bacterium]|nr:cysteine desulfurase [Clostridia bacterium]